MINVLLLIERNYRPKATGFGGLLVGPQSMQ